MKLLIGTRNPGKQQEFEWIFNRLAEKYQLKFELVTPHDLSIHGDVVEDKKTFCDNAEKKAKWYFEKTGLTVMADDGGLEIEVLNGQPGVYSRRWPGYEAEDDELITYTLAKLKDYSAQKDRQAQLVTCVTFYDGQNLIQGTGSIKGYISDRPSIKRTPGYPFRDIFIVKKLGKYYNELTYQEHEEINHRRQAAEKIVCQLLKNKIWSKIPNSS